MRKLPVVIMVLTLVASGAYVAVYLNRWEWTRALFVMMVFLAAEVALAGWLVMERLKRVEELVAERDDASRIFDDAVLMRLRQTRPEYDRFAWLQESVTRTNVFITLVVGGGVLLSALAWGIDKVAGRTVTSSRERQMARELSTIAFPTGHLVADETSLVAQELPSCDDPELRLLVGDTRGYQR